MHRRQACDLSFASTPASMILLSWIGFQYITAFRLSIGESAARQSTYSLTDAPSMLLSSSTNITSTLPRTGALAVDDVRVHHDVVRAGNETASTASYRASESSSSSLICEKCVLARPLQEFGMRQSSWLLLSTTSARPPSRCLRMS